MKLINWIWSLLPDKCQQKECSRFGVRGNENLMEGEIVCDHCVFKQQPPITGRG